MSSPLRRENGHESPGDESQDARAWITVAVVVVIVLVAYLGISAGMMSSHEASDADAVQTVPPVAPPPSPTREAAPGGFDDLGALPGLLDDFSSTPDCDFDDALSTCQ